MTVMICMFAGGSSRSFLCYFLHCYKSTNKSPYNFQVKKYKSGKLVMYAIAELGLISATENNLSQVLKCKNMGGIYLAMKY